MQELTGDQKKTYLEILCKLRFVSMCFGAVQKLQWWYDGDAIIPAGWYDVPTMETNEQELRSNQARSDDARKALLSQLKG